MGLARIPEWERWLKANTERRCEFPHFCKHCCALDALKEIEALRRIADDDEPC